MWVCGLNPDLTRDNLPTRLAGTSSAPKRKVLFRYAAENRRRWGDNRSRQTKRKKKNAHPLTWFVSRRRKRKKATCRDRGSLSRWRKKELYWGRGREEKGGIGAFNAAEQHGRLREKKKMGRRRPFGGVKGHLFKRRRTSATRMRTARIGKKKQ